MEHDPNWLMVLAATGEEMGSWLGQQAKVGHLILTAVLAVTATVSIIFTQAERLTRLEDRMTASEDRGKVYRDRLEKVENKEQLDAIETARRDSKIDAEHKAIMDLITSIPRTGASVTVRR